MKNIQFLSILIFFLFFNNQLTAQSKIYEKGYMITNTKDTIVGYIQDKKSVEFANQFSFKTDLDGRAKTITTSDAIGFYFEPSFYYDLINVSFQEKDKKQFVRKLATGYTNLYKLPNGEYTDFILEKTTGEKLQVSKRDSTIGSKYYDDKRYFGQIKLFLSDCKDIAVNTKSIHYDEKTIAKLVTQYNECIQPNVKNSNISEGRKLKVQFGLKAGLYPHEVQVSGLQAPKRFVTANSTSYQLGGIVSFSYFKKLSIQSGLLFNHYTSFDIYTYSLGTIDISHDIKTLEFPIELRYNLFNKPATPYLIGSIRTGRTLNATSTQVRIEAATTIIDEEYDLLFNRGFGYSVGVGYSIPVGNFVELNIDVTYSQLELYYLITADAIFKGYMINASILF